MRLTDDIRNYQFSPTPLQSQQHKTYREYEALAVLKYSFPEMFSSLHKAEEPDLQDSAGEIGVEVTWGGSPVNELINSESAKYPHATEENKEKILNRIREHGGDRIGPITSFPLGTEDADKTNILRAFQNKVQKAEKYKQGFSNIGLVITIDIPLSIYPDYDWGKELEPYNNNMFNFAILLHMLGVSMYDFRTKEYTNKDIPKEDWCALRKLSRMTVEGIISDADPTWN